MERARRNVGRRGVKPKARSITPARGPTQSMQNGGLGQRQNATLFVFQLIVISIIIVACIWILLGNFPLLSKTGCAGVLFYIVRSFVKHMTTKGY